MDTNMYCLVDARGNVYVKDGAESFDDVALEHGLAESECQECRFDLATRRLFVEQSTGEAAAQRFITGRLGTPERLMAFAGEGHLSKQVMAQLLMPKIRQPYLAACTRIERAYTAACLASKDPCLAEGCSVEGEDEICLDPILRAGTEYPRACAAEWIKLFRAPANRIAAWRNSSAPTDAASHS
jgi:hypothetical protein